MTSRPFTPHAELRDVTLRDRVSTHLEEPAHRPQGADNP